MAYAASVVPNVELQPIDEYDLASNARPARKDVFDDFSWFDLGKASNVVCAGGGSSQPRVWVDKTRCVFYYSIGD